MGLVQSPVVKIARRFIAKHNLTVPFDLKALVKQYAEVTYASIPEDGVDGVCIHLKTPGKKPRVIINRDIPLKRQKFTLAHELGHIIIPWHVGNFVDEIDENNLNNNTRYRELEREANRFASEILMPFDWIYELCHKDASRVKLKLQLLAHCGVSEQAADIRLDAVLPEIEQLVLTPELILKTSAEYKDLAIVHKELVEKTKFSPIRVAQFIARAIPIKIAYCVECNGKVLSSGGSESAFTYSQYEGQEFFDAPYPYYNSHTIAKFQNINFHWWDLHINLPIKPDDRSWREILDDILSRSYSGKKATIMGKINGKISGAFSVWKTKYGLIEMDKFIENTLHRFNNAEYAFLISDPDFTAFIKNRVEALFANTDKID